MLYLLNAPATLMGTGLVISVNNFIFQVAYNWNIMKKIIFGIFAHPDDEAFGPVGTLLLETHRDNELHLMTLTDGAAGTNPDKLEDLGTTRLKEWRAAGALLGAHSMHHLGYRDNTLNNLDMIAAAERIEALISTTLQGTPDTVEIEFMTLDLNGYTGHIDHIVAARAACLVFYRLKENDNRFTRIRLACLSETEWPKQNTNWIYMEKGRHETEIDETIDARHFREEILEVMHAHYSQRGDGNAKIERSGTNLGRDYFIVKD